jgi:hypothetical protein
MFRIGRISGVHGTCFSSEVSQKSGTSEATCPGHTARGNQQQESNQLYGGMLVATSHLLPFTCRLLSTICRMGTAVDSLAPTLTRSARVAAGVEFRVYPPVREEGPPAWGWKLEDESWVDSSLLWGWVNKERLPRTCFLFFFSFSSCVQSLLKGIAV